MILPFLNNLSVIIPNNILKIGINVDGLPLAKTSKSQFYPIFISILNIKQRPNLVIPIGIFHEYTKPGYVEEFIDLVKNIVVFLGTDAPLRTNESFCSKLDEDYHKGDSPLEKLPINIVDTVCLDYMHNCCQGVMKRLLELWVKGKKMLG